jgi:hypothetical protein
MARIDRQHAEELKEGQLWKVEHGYVYIVELGIRFIRYQLRRDSQATAAATQMIGILPLVNFLRYTQASLVECRGV